MMSIYFVRPPTKERNDTIQQQKKEKATRHADPAQDRTPQSVKPPDEAATEDVQEDKEADDKLPLGGACKAKWIKPTRFAAHAPLLYRV